MWTAMLEANVQSLDVFFTPYTYARVVGHNSVLTLYTICTQVVQYHYLKLPGHFEYICTLAMLLLCQQDGFVALPLETYYRWNATFSETADFKKIQFGWDLSRKKAASRTWKPQKFGTEQEQLWFWRTSRSLNPTYTTDRLLLIIHKWKKTWVYL